MRPPRLPPLAAAAMLASLAGCAAPAAPGPAPAPAVATPEEGIDDATLVAVAVEEDPGHDEALERWDDLPWRRRCAALRRGLHSPDDRVALHAARELPGASLSLAEIRRQMDLLVRRPGALFTAAGDEGCWGSDGGYSIGSPEVVEALEAALRAGRLGEPDHTIQDLHRPMTPEAIPALVELLDRTRGEDLRQVYWFLRLLADNTNAHRAHVARGILYLVECCRAESEGRGEPRLRDTPLPEVGGPGLPDAFRRLASLHWSLDADPAHAMLRERLRFPDPWLFRWAVDLEPVREDLPFLFRAAKGTEDMNRAWAVQWIHRIGGERATTMLAELEALGVPVPEYVQGRPLEAGSFPGNGWWLEEESEDVDPEWVLQDLPALHGLRESDPAGFERLLDQALDGGDRRRRLRALLVLARLGRVDHLAETMEAIGAGTGLTLAEWAVLGRIRDPRMETFLRERIGSGRTVPPGELAALAVFHGLPEKVLPVFDRFPRTSGDPIGKEARDRILEGDPVAAALVLCRNLDVLPGAVAHLGATEDPRAVAYLRELRDRREEERYWPATAGLALAGDREAREEYLAFLREDRVFLQDGMLDGFLLGLDGDREAVEHWISRVSSNCCLGFHAQSVLTELFPTLDLEHWAVQYRDERGRVARWFRERNFRWSRLLDGWVPVAR